MNIARDPNIDHRFFRLQRREQDRRGILKSEYALWLELLHDHAFDNLIVAVDTPHHGVEDRLHAIINVPCISTPGNM